MNKKELKSMENESEKSLDSLFSIIADLFAEINDLQDEVENLKAELLRYQEEDI